MAKIKNFTSSYALPTLRASVGWGALLAAAMTGISCFLLLSSFGVAVGLTLGDQQLEGATVAWIIFSLFISLFFAGWVSGQWIHRESKAEAVVYGACLWTLVALSSVAFVHLGIRTDLSAMGGISTILSRVADRTLAGNDRQVFQRALDANEQSLNDVQSAMQGRFGRVFAASGLQISAWWTFFGVLGTWLACVSGALAGVHTNFLLRRRPREVSIDEAAEFAAA